jgi:uncharacterized DUF497 family protein
MNFEWDPAKAAANLKKHRVSFADAVLSLEDSLALTMPDPDSCGQERFICLGADPSGRLLVTVFVHRADRIRIIASGKASRGERLIYETKR